MQCIGVSCKQGRYACKTPGVCKPDETVKRPAIVQSLYDTADFVIVFAQLRKTHPEQTRCKSLRVAFKACWPNPSK